jgi:hypothetical protein
MRTILTALALFAVACGGAPFTAGEPTPDGGLVVVDAAPDGGADASTDVSASDALADVSDEISHEACCDECTSAWTSCCTACMSTCPGAEPGQVAASCPAVCSIGVAWTCVDAGADAGCFSVAPPTSACNYVLTTCDVDRCGGGCGRPDPYCPTAP